MTDIARRDADAYAALALALRAELAQRDTGPNVEFIPELGRVVAVFHDHGADLAQFIADHPNPRALALSLAALVVDHLTGRRPLPNDPDAMSHLAAHIHARNLEVESEERSDEEQWGPRAE